MSNHPSHGRPDRRWMRNDFELVGLPPFEPSEAVVPPRLWGRTRWTLRADEGHLVVDVSYAPRGFLVVGRCHECGGRAEGLADLTRDSRDRSGQDRRAQVGLRRATNDEPPDVLTDAVERVTESLRSRHRSCSRSPQENRLHPMTRRLVESAVSGARESLETEGVVEGNLHLLLEDGRACTLPTSQIVRGAPPRSLERNVNRAAATAATRAFLRARDLRPVAAVLVSEAWASPMEEGTAVADDEREEVLVVSVVTPEFGRIGYSTIERTSGVVEEGPGRFGSLEWNPLTEPAPLVDGVFAGSDLTIHRPEDISRRSGTTLSRESHN